MTFFDEDPAGTWLKLKVIALDTRILDFHSIRVSNAFGEDKAIFRVVPVGPMVDYWTPSAPVRGQAYALSLAGNDLLGAQVIPVLSNHLRFYSLDNSRNNRLNAVLDVLPGAPIGPPS